MAATTRTPYQSGLEIMKQDLARAYSNYAYHVQAGDISGAAQYKREINRVTRMIRREELDLGLIQDYCTACGDVALDCSCEVDQA